MNKALAILLLCLMIGAPAFAQTATPTPPLCGTPTPGVQQYWQKVNSYSPIAYWVLDDGSSTADDTSGNGRTGSYTGGVTQGQSGIGDGRNASSFDGVDDRVNVYSASLASAFNGSEGTILVWFTGAAWTDGTLRYALRLQVDANNEIVIRRTPTNNQITAIYRAGGTLEQVFHNTSGGTGWYVAALSWSKSNDRMRFYMAGTQTGSTQTGLGTWAGSLASTGAVIGQSSSSATTNAWSGKLAHVAVFGAELSSSAISDLASVPSYAPPTPTPIPGCVDAYPTATPTPTPTGAIYVVWTLAPVASGTPGQAVAFVYEMSAGGVVNNLLLFVLLVSLLVIITLVLMRRKT